MEIIFCLAKKETRNYERIMYQILNLIAEIYKVDVNLITLSRQKNVQSMKKGWFHEMLENLYISISSLKATRRVRVYADDCIYSGF